MIRSKTFKLFLILAFLFIASANTKPSEAFVRDLFGHQIYVGFGFEQPISRETVIKHELRTLLDFPILLAYRSWFDGDLDSEFMSQFSRVDKTPLITWMPGNTNVGVGPSQPEYKLSTIFRGDHDEYIRRNARNIKEYKKPVFIRFGHEMNGNWYSWGSGVNGNEPEDFTRAWNFVQDIFKSEGVSNATWVWSPNIDGGRPDAPGIEEFFPGNDRVDWVGFSGYNWGNTQSWSSWENMESILNRTYSKLTSLTNKPIMIAETASTESGGDKAEWIKEAFQILPSYKQVKAIVWFNLNKDTDWRVESSRKSEKAFRRAVLPLQYRGGVKIENNKILPR